MLILTYINIYISVNIYLEKILKAAIPQQQATTTTSQQAPIAVKVFIGTKEIKDIYTEMNTGSKLPIATNKGS